VSRYLDIFVASDEDPARFAASLETHLKLSLERVTDRGEEVLYLYSGEYKWFDVCRGMLDRHPNYAYQLYVGRGHHDVGDRLRANFALYIIERLAPHYPLIFEDNVSGVSLTFQRGDMPPSGVLAKVTQAGAGDVATIFAASDDSPVEFAESLAEILHMEAHISSRARSPVIAVMVGEAVRIRVEEHDYEDAAGLSLRAMRYCIDLDPLDAAGVFSQLKASRRYRLLWLQNLETIVDQYDPALERA